jgi:hypothetical protein
MATLYATNATQHAAVPSGKSKIGEQGGVVRCIYDEYTATASNTPSNGDVIKFGGLIPKGARVLEAVMSFEDMGGTGTAEFGWAASADAVEAGDADGFHSTIDLDTAADNIIGSQDDANVPGIGYKFAAACQPIVTVTDAWSATSGAVRCYILYILD